jgi:UDP-glucose 4-epimerase
MGNPITIYGTGNQTRDFTYVDDVVKAMVLLTDEYNGNDVFNIARGKDCSILELAEYIKSYFNSSSQIIKCNVPRHRYDFEVERRFGNSEKLNKAIDYKPSTSFKLGFRKIYSGKEKTEDKY